jgi:hypothetical protein
MAVEDEVAFSLSRFGWTPPNQVDVTGAWHGVERRDMLSSPVLVLHTPGRTHRLEAVDGDFTRTRHWSAAFIWQGDPESVDRAELEVGGAWVVELPAAGQGRRRLGRVVLPVRELERPGAGSEMVSADSDVLALHAALVEAQDELAEARDETERVSAHARQERMRRESDVARLQESMSELRQLAQRSFEKEREEARARLDGVMSELAAAEGRAVEADELRSELATAQRKVELAETEINRLRAQLLAVREVVEQESVR